MDNKLIGFIAWWLVIIGGINWGLMGLVDLDVVRMILRAPLLVRFVYILVGAASAYLLYERYFMKRI